ncbi:MAG: monooxygenase [Rhodovulum sulfidophilum]|uniref:Monooxygenase n=1 Tax=Rhodovulum sulfidophilum TaxID=35806 RepID=A0A2W5NCC2_RHOSU|nr:MAG: monooxygenase [Rhodovulum sulfidophilum]
MGRTEFDWRTEATSRYDTLAARFRPLFARIAEGAVAREKERRLPVEELDWLRDSGFTAVRVPLEHGGGGASLPDLFRLLIDLAEADSNLPQALRAHFAFIEDRLNAPEAEALPWFARFIAGDTVGSAWTEVGAVKLGAVATRLRPDGDGFRLDGEKYYSTGTIFADWIDVYTERDDTGAPVIALTATDQPGVTPRDDWNGFGQRTTGSGATVFEGARVEAANVYPFETRFRYQTAYYQLVLNAVLAGSARAAVSEAARLLKARTRAYSHGNGRVAPADPQLLQVIGRAKAAAYAAEAVTIAAAATTEQALFARRAGDAAAEAAANVAAELESAQAQVIAADLAFRATTEIFNALGASAVDRDLALDRHWRNARTAASHNPLVYKERVIGDHAVNGTEPVYVWQIGQG